MVNIAKTLNSFQVVIKPGRSNLSGHKSVVVRRSHIPDHNGLKVALFVVFMPRQFFGLCYAENFPGRK